MIWNLYNGDQPKNLVTLNNDDGRVFRVAMEDIHLTVINNEVKHVVDLDNGERLIVNYDLLVENLVCGVA